MIRLGRDICGNAEAAQAREWLVCNGKGGYASGTVSGQLTRGYHGVLVAALSPPLGRTLMLASLLETVTVGGRRFELGTLRWRDGTLAPAGHRLLESFVLDGTVPVWRYACADALIEKRLWMEPGANTTHVAYRLLHAQEPIELEIAALVDHRDYHGRTTGGWWQTDVRIEDDRATVTAYPGAAPLYVRAGGCRLDTACTWYRNFDLARERDRGLQDVEDHLHALTIRARLAPGETVRIIASSEGMPEDDPGAFDRRQAYEADLLDRWARRRPERVRSAPDWVRQLVLAADQFIAVRRKADGTPGHTVIAGYPWFADWGRDTMISLPGLTLCTGRPEIAASILRTFAAYIDGGMLPNRFPDAGEQPEYNTVDAGLWYFDAVRRVFDETGDDSLLAELFPVLRDMVDWHCRGTRYGIVRDPADGLLRAGEAGQQLTWMDARVNGREITPRTGKPVEVNALWYAALRFMERSARRLGQPADEFHRLADAAEAGFARFWNPAAGYCFDVLDGPGGHEAVLRPNQILAASLPDSALSPSQRRAVVSACERSLLTSCGLRTLDPLHPEYRGRFGGDQASRDACYHRGPVWGWLIGPFIEAWLRTGGDPGIARLRVEALGDQVRVEGQGTVNELFDGDEPMDPRGCIAQAWSVAEYLRAWDLVVAAERAAETVLPLERIADGPKVRWRQSARKIKIPE